MADKVKLNSGVSLTSFLRAFVAEGVKSALAQKALTEKEKQNSMGGGTSGPSDDSDEEDLFGDSGEGGDDEEQDTSSKTMDDETESMEGGEVEVKDIVDKLNSIRGGKSFKDEEVAKALDEYLSSLSDAEKTALMAFLKGIAQIVTGEISGEEATDPGKNGDVKMEKGHEKKVKHISPNVIAGGGNGGNGKSKSSAEDTTAPAPITPKRRH